MSDRRTEKIDAILKHYMQHRAAPGSEVEARGIIGRLYEVTIVEKTRDGTTRGSRWVLNEGSPLIVELSDDGADGFPEFAPHGHEPADERKLSDEDKTSEEDRPSLVAPPGSILVRLVSLLAKKNALRTIVEMSIADMRAELYEALASGDRAQGRWIVVRGHASAVWAALVYVGVWAVLGKVMKLWRGE